MGKKDKHKGRKEEKQEKGNKLKDKRPKVQADGSETTYADGTLLDRVQYLEAKLIRSPTNSLRCKPFATSASSCNELRRSLALVSSKTVRLG